MSGSTVIDADLPGLHVEDTKATKGRTRFRDQPKNVISEDPWRRENFPNGRETMDGYTVIELKQRLMWSEFKMAFLACLCLLMFFFTRILVEKYDLRLIF